MRYHYTTSQWLPCRLELAFSFFANPNNLPLLMPHWQRVRIDSLNLVRPSDAASSSADIAGQGTTMRISFRPVPYLPLRQTWRAVISEFTWNNRFCDEQKRGPFAYWKHCHRIREESHAGASGTLITDDVAYEMKMGPFGDFAHRLFVVRQIRNLFLYRQQQVEKLLLPDREENS